MIIDGLQYCNWSEKIFKQWRQSNLTAVHVTIAYHEQFRETILNFEKWNSYFELYPNLIKPAFSGEYISNSVDGNNKLAVESLYKGTS